MARRRACLSQSHACVFTGFETGSQRVERLVCLNELRSSNVATIITKLSKPEVEIQPFCCINLNDSERPPLPLKQRTPICSFLSQQYMLWLSSVQSRVHFWGDILTRIQADLPKPDTGHQNDILIFTAVLTKLLLLYMY